MKQKFIDLKRDLELIENNRAVGVLTCNPEEKVLKTWDTIPNTFICLKKISNCYFINFFIYVLL